MMGLHRGSKPRLELLLREVTDVNDSGSVAEHEVPEWFETRDTDVGAVPGDGVQHVKDRHNAGQGGNGDVLPAERLARTNDGRLRRYTLGLVNRDSQLVRKLVEPSDLWPSDRDDFVFPRFPGKCHELARQVQSDHRRSIVSSHQRGEVECQAQ